MYIDNLIGHIYICVKIARRDTRFPYGKSAISSYLGELDNYCAYRREETNRYTRHRASMLIKEHDREQKYTSYISRMSIRARVCVNVSGKLRHECGVCQQRATIRFYQRRPIGRTRGRIRIASQREIKY